MLKILFHIKPFYQQYIKQYIESFFMHVRLIDQFYLNSQNLSYFFLFYKMLPSYNKFLNFYFKKLTAYTCADI